MGHFSDPVLARTAPADLTIADCIEGRFNVCVWCPGVYGGQRCTGRDIALDQMPALADRKLLDLAREGRFVCKSCDQPADMVTVSSTEHAERILFWRIGDDAMPAGGLDRRTAAYASARGSRS